MSIVDVEINVFFNDHITRVYIIDDYDEFEREGRIFTSGGSLNLNSTFLTAAGVIMISVT